MPDQQSPETTSLVSYPGGLKVTDLGLNGLVVEPTEHFSAAVSRHQNLLNQIDLVFDLAAGPKLLILLVTNEFILNLSRLQSAVQMGAQTYRDTEAHYIEFSFGNGWRDRRQLSDQTVGAIELNRGCVVSRVDWKVAADFIGVTRRELSPSQRWTSFLDDAQCWWFQHLPGPLFMHALGLSRFQMLPRHALARVSTGLPKRPTTNLLDPADSVTATLVESTFKSGRELKLFDELIAFAGKVARDKPSKSKGRELVLEKIQLLIPVASSAGRGQLIVLGGIKHALSTGGTRGGLWAPITVYEYLRQGLKELAEVFCAGKLDEMDGAQFHAEYIKILAGIKASQRSKFEAFLLAFHRFLVICGFDPLPRSLSVRQDHLPPMASVVTQCELDLALQYINEVAPNERVALQGRLGLMLAYWVPIRTVELWCLRVGDVSVEAPMFMTIYPRGRDGVGKTPSLRRHEDLQPIDSPLLKALLIDMVGERRVKDFADSEDFLLGRPGYPDERYELLLTNKLMNDALRWATGDEEARFYSLRHVAISRRASSTLLEAINGD